MTSKRQSRIPGGFDPKTKTSENNGKPVLKVASRRSKPSEDKLCVPDRNTSEDDLGEANVETLENKKLRLKQKTESRIRRSKHAEEKGVGLETGPGKRSWGFREGCEVIETFMTSESPFKIQLFSTKQKPLT
ncbi:hypothetical protein L596_007002 [Steinernema carpocapsae]|uniref:Uncharacterized protein n=1 Tax=Steinernema carpocapsae TaxID=34508 RepID=A0A4V6A5U0_STECR|nr:hypothetical protein L596_007002 [Steinernema carpocapsae]